jgi:muramoyltetrapeptide carboxypeptidase LdcA involved in peptidoglycan recycling
MGVLDKLSGLIVGRPMRYADEQKDNLRQVILERTSMYTFLIITDMDFGHTSPQFTIPIGCRCRIDSEERTFAITDAAVG